MTLAAILAAGTGLAAQVAAQDATSDGPILTKSGQQAALEAAAAAIRSGQPSSGVAQGPAAPALRAAPMLPGASTSGFSTFAAPTNPTDPTRVPHYFGPFPNWANSPFTLADAPITINGNGTGAKAEATVGANGVITGITVTNPGSGYTSATVVIGGSGTGASAHATVNSSGSVTAVTVGAKGGGYKAPVAAITGGNGSGATATVYGGVDAVTLVNAGTGYSLPTVDFDLPDGPNGVKAVGHAVCDQGAEGACGPGLAISSIVVDQAGSGYSTAPGVAIRDGTQFDPVTDGGHGAVLTATLKVQSMTLERFGSGYTVAPTVTISDSQGGSGTGATASATIDFGAVTSIVVDTAGKDYLNPDGIRKFVDGLPGLCDPRVSSGVGSCGAAANNLGQYIPLGVPDQTTFTKANGFADDADYYVIALVQTRERLSSSLPGTGTLLREYVQLETSKTKQPWSKSILLQNTLPDGSTEDVLLPDGSPAIGVDNPHYLGPIIVATKGRPVRIVFYNLLPKGQDGNLYIPMDSTLMGAGFGPSQAWPVLQDNGTVLDPVRNPPCTQEVKNEQCYTDNRATLHLHGGTSPWISDGTPHQWITPKGDATVFHEGESVGNVPDMSSVAGVPDCSGADDGCQTFYYTNQQSARLLFYHDHASGITRLNVYLGEAAGYLIRDTTEANLISTGTIPGDEIPLVIQDRTFVPSGHAEAEQTPTQLDKQDPTWDVARWGDKGYFWYHHVYMPAQNPGDPSGMSAFGRWMYGPWFWPPADPPYGPIANPYYDPACDLDIPATWTYQTDPFCEPAKIPGTPNISTGMEQFNDTPLVNGTAYPTMTVDPKPYRLRILNAANDRFFNLQWYVADSSTASTAKNHTGVEAIGGTEVAFKQSELDAAQLDPNVFPTPDTTRSPVGPSWIQIGSEGGFLPTPAVIPNQPITWITDPTRFDVGNVDQHSLLLGSAERADVIVDFSDYAGQTLILYNDAPAAFPARVASYDYYTGGPDLSPAGAPTTLPGFGPNTRTIMQVKVNGGSGTAFNLKQLQDAFLHKADGSGVFESGQHPIIVGQAAYNPAYGTGFAASSYCNGGNTTSICDGFARIADQGGTLFGFNTLRRPTVKTTITVDPKAIHDEMNSANFDEFGRMTANMGVEVVPANPVAQNIVLYPYINPPTELINGTDLPKGMTVTALASGADGTQIWKITHNGVDTHPLHFHLYDVQLLNRVTWDNIIIPPDANELGWKDTVRTSPLEDTIVALRPIIPQVPFELPNSIRMLNPAMPGGTAIGFNPIDPNGTGAAVTNQLVNFGWEYVWHCHILSHEEMDMMRPQALALPPATPTGLGYAIVAGQVALTWNDNSITETSFDVQRTINGGTTWSTIGSIASPLNLLNTHRTGLNFTDTATVTPGPNLKYRVVANNRIGYGGAFPEMTASSTSDAVTVTEPPPIAPEIGPAQLSNGIVTLGFKDNSTDETGFLVQRTANGGTTWTQLTLSPYPQFGPFPGTSNQSYVDTLAAGLEGTFRYRIAAVKNSLQSDFSGMSNAVTTPPAAPGWLAPVKTRVGTSNTANTRVNWTDLSAIETTYRVQRSSNVGFPAATTTTMTFPANTTTTTPTFSGNRNTKFYYRVRAENVSGNSAWIPLLPTDGCVAADNAGPANPTGGCP